LFLWVVPSLGLWAQTTSTEILGLVTDSSGAVVPGAKVTVARRATGEIRSAVTNQAGDYSFPLVQIGDYTVRCEMAGFKTQTVSTLRVETEQKVRVNFVLEVGEVTETVEVTAAGVLLKTDDATVGQVIDNRRVIELPLNGRNLSHLAVLVAGVQFGRRTGMADGQGGFPIPGAAVSIIANGIRETYGTVALDGVDAKNPRTHTTVFTPSIEAVEEFKVQTSSYSAEFGMGGGGIIQVSMKSGTNQLRGTFFEFLRNDRLDAENYFLNFEQPAGAARLPKDRLRRNQFGAIISGPVLLPGYNGRNRTFWAFDYEGRRDTTERVATAFFPPDTFRNGDFSALLNPAINPATARPFRAPIAIFDPLTGVLFPSNIIPASRIHPGARNLMKFIPPAQFAQADILDFTARASVPDTITQNQYFWRVDHQLSPVDKVFVRYAADRSDFGQSYVNPNFPIAYSSRGTNLASQWVHTFSPKMFNEARFGFNMADDDIGNPRTNTDFDIDSLNIGKFRIVNDGNRPLTPRETGVPLITQFFIGDRDTGNGYDRQLALQFANNLSINHDRHTFKMGVEYRRAAMTRGGANEPRGSLNFTANESGYPFASFLMGYPNTVRSPESLNEHRPRTNRWGLYFLDDFKATTRLTINIGLRWDYFGTPVEPQGKFRSLSFDSTFTTGSMQIPTIFPAEIGERGAVKLWAQEYRYLMPRVGIAFRPTDRWVIRMGAGWFSNIEHMNTYSILQNMPPYGGSQQFAAVTDPVGSGRRFRPGSPVVSFDDPFGGSAAVRPINVLAIQPDHKNPNHWQWSFDIQRQLPWDTAVTVGYVGSKSSNVGDSLVNWNSPDPSADTNFQRRRPYQIFYDLGSVQDLGQVRFIRSDENGFYHGLQTTVEKRYTRGLAYGFSYTFSKAHGDGESNGNNPADFPNPRERRGARGRYLFDLRHTAVFHFVYELPFGQRLHGPAALLLKGWQTNGVLSLRSGFPFAVSQGSSDLNTDNSPGRPDRIRDGRLFGNATRRLWFDPSAFSRVTCNNPSRPDLCRYGNAGRGILESPGQRNLDLSIFKNFEIRENWKVQFRSEFFNFTNTPYFNQPNGITFSTLTSLAPDGPRDGEVRSLRAPMRIIQFGLKVFF
jgi:hypothetical protein